MNRRTRALRSWRRTTSNQSRRPALRLTRRPLSPALPTPRGLRPEATAPGPRRSDRPPPWVVGEGWVSRWSRSLQRPSPRSGRRIRLRHGAGPPTTMTTMCRYRSCRAHPQPTSNRVPNWEQRPARSDRRGRGPVYIASPTWTQLPPKGRRCPNGRLTSPHSAARRPCSNPRWRSG